MYEEKVDELDEKEGDDDDDELKKRKFVGKYSPRRIVAPPEYPFAYYRIRRNQLCVHCECVGKECHNIRYGNYLATVVARFYYEHQDSYNEHDAARVFLETYAAVSDFEDYLPTNAIPESSAEKTLPECLAFDSLVFALNSVEWAVMWEMNNKRIKAKKIQTKQKRQIKERRFKHTW